MSMLPEVFFDHFYQYDEMTAFLEETHAKYPAFLELDTLGKTAENRELRVATITDPSTGPAANKPAYLVLGGVHAQEGAGTTAALHILRTILSDDHAGDLLKKIAFYIIPRVNPDGTEFALTHRARIRSRMDETDTTNGLVPRDINGDGLILSMRWEDTAGPMTVDSEEPRLMIRRKPGDRGPFYHVVTEGVIHNHNGENLVEGTRLIDFNRNWAEKWKNGRNGGYYPFSEMEVRSLADFLIHHPNIFAGIDLHCGNNAIFYPHTDSNSNINQSDLEILRTVGLRAEAHTGFPLMHIKEYWEPWKNPRELCGMETDWMYHTLGIPVYTIELGNGFNDAGISTKAYFEADTQTREELFMRRILEYHDSKGVPLFVPWQTCDHPQLGSVEVGGLMNGSGYFMCPSSMEQIAPRVTAFALEHAHMHGELAFSKVEVKRFGMNLWRIRTAVTNIGAYGTQVMQGGGADFMRFPVRARLQKRADISVVSRKELIECVQLAGSGTRMECEWFVIVEGEKSICIETSHPRGGTIRARVSLES